MAALLTLAQGEQGPLVLESVDLATLAAETATGRGLDVTGLTIHTDLRRAVVAGADPTLLASLIASLIGNLLDNAIRHSLAGGRVDVDTRSCGSRAVLAISNSGPVVPEDAVDRTLRPFQRLTAPRMPNPTSGLGLAVVRPIADIHGADLRVVPNPGGGLTVTVGFADT